MCAFLFSTLQVHILLFVGLLYFKIGRFVIISYVITFHRDTLVSRTSHLKEGLNRLFSLVPYEIITSEIWDYVMPNWMEAMVNDVPEKEQHELKNLLRSDLSFCLIPYLISCIHMLQHKC
jgi:hypothetical protein